MLSEKQLEDVCLIGKEANCCRYLCEDEGDHYCLKKSSKKATIDTEVGEFLAFCNKKQIDPKDFYLPIADNCFGFPLLKNTKQGYDIEN